MDQKFRLLAALPVHVFQGVFPITFIHNGPIYLIEMRQIGVRNEAALHGGLACCGRELCCASFLKEFAPVSIRMAKEQSLPLDPEKISGICGRLLCCLLYEHHVYQELSQSLPKLGKKIRTPVGPCRVVRYNIFRQTVVLENQEGREVEIPAEELRRILAENQEGA